MNQEPGKVQTEINGWKVALTKEGKGNQVMLKCDDKVLLDISVSWSEYQVRCGGIEFDPTAGMQILYAKPSEGASKPLSRGAVPPLRRCESGRFRR